MNVAMMCSNTIKEKVHVRSSVSCGKNEGESSKTEIQFRGLV